ncbi:unnamed protein product [Diamesa serratosioi]
MVAMKYFCFYFPVRFGVVIVSCLGIIQGLIPIILFLVWDAAKLKEFVRNFQENIGDYSSNFVFDRFLEIVENYPVEFRYSVLLFHGVFIIACLINIVAALRTIKWLTIPYILMDFVRILYILAAHTLLMMVWKKQLNLGVLIALTVLGGFLILYLFYLMFCSVALFQIINIVNSKEYKVLVRNLVNPIVQMYKMPDYASVTPEKVTIKKPKVKPINTALQYGLNNQNQNPGMFASDFSGLNKKKGLRI